MEERQETAHLSPAQREIMEIVWQRGESSVGEIWRRIAQRRRVARNTVLSVVMILVEKGWLVPRREGNAFRYTAAFPKSHAQADEIRRLVNTVFDGSAEGLVMTLLEDGGLSPDEAKRIREMILAKVRTGRKGK